MSPAAFLALSLIIAPSAPPAPPVIEAPASPKLVDFKAGEVMCDGGAVSPLLVEQPFPITSWIERKPVEVRFRIDEQGRPLGIEAGHGQTQFAPDEAGEVEPALAAWRFPKDAPKRECRVTFVPHAAAIEAADPLVAYRYAAFARGFRGPNGLWYMEAFDRAFPEGSDCRDRPRPRSLSYPEFDEVPQPAGTTSLVMFNYDVDPRGKAKNIRLIQSTGNKTLDRSAADAVGKSSWAAQARQGCVGRFYNFSREVMAPPPPPEPRDFRPAGATCPTDKELPWKSPLKLNFPYEFLRRRIEGWAVVTYDVAPWGAVGNVKLAAAEPAQAFGRQAVRVISNAAKQGARSGYVGCTAFIRFAMPEKEEEGRDTED